MQRRLSDLGERDQAKLKFFVPPLEQDPLFYGISQLVAKATAMSSSQGRTTTPNNLTLRT